MRFVPNDINIYKRPKGLTLANVYAKKVWKDMTKLTIVEAKEKVAVGDDTDETLLSTSLRKLINI